MANAFKSKNKSVSLLPKEEGVNKADKHGPIGFHGPSINSLFLGVKYVIFHRKLTKPTFPVTLSPLRLSRQQRSQGYFATLQQGFLIHMADALQVPPKSGFHHHSEVVIHRAYHYLTYHHPVGDPVKAVNVPGEESPEQSAEATTNS